MQTATVFNVQKFSLNDGPGIRTVVFLKGCPLRCQWCANPESQRREPELEWERASCVGCGHCVDLCAGAGERVTAPLPCHSPLVVCPRPSAQAVWCHEPKARLSLILSLYPIDD
ncbi:4Fe-4S cluster-binding domain-containing protein [Olsenella phocaeensis]|uniref:4Fe-4S cluster-binding domain-containing protein n=1 Tax=Olsenella phocaeensis TaxID=1852385 RepID=UPI003899413B